MPKGPATKIVFVDEKTGDRAEFEHPGGIVDYLEKLVAEKGKPTVHKDAFTIEHEDGPRFEVALRWTESTEEVSRSYANGIPTGSGGTHENGFKQGLAKAIRNHMETQKLTPKGVKVSADDIREGLVAVVSVYVEEPQFQGQTKDRLNNPEVAALFRQLAGYGDDHVEEVRERAAGVDLPAIPPWDFKWICPEGPESSCMEDAHYLMSKCQALELAFHNEARGRDFYAEVAAMASDAEVRRVSAEMAEEEDAHVRMLREWIKREACETAKAPEDLDPPNIPG